MSEEVNMDWVDITDQEMIERLNIAADESNLRQCQRYLPIQTTIARARCLLDRNHEGNCKFTDKVICE